MSHFLDEKGEDEPAWYALRNAIYASGCRIEMAKRASFREAREAAWLWFENALSVHSELLYWQPTVIGVQALTVMVSFFSTPGNPSLISPGIFFRGHQLSSAAVHATLVGI